MATKEHGEETVKAAMEWGMQRAQQSPGFAAEYMRQRHPIDWAVSQHKEQIELQEMRADKAAYIRKHATALGLIPQATPQSASAPAAPQPHASARTRSAS